MGYIAGSWTTGCTLLSAMHCGIQRLDCTVKTAPNLSARRFPSVVHFIANRGAFWDTGLGATLQIKIEAMKSEESSSVLMSIIRGAGGALDAA